MKGSPLSESGKSGEILRLFSPPINSSGNIKTTPNKQTNKQTNTIKTLSCLANHIFPKTVVSHPTLSANNFQSTSATPREQLREFLVSRYPRQPPAKSDPAPSDEKAECAQTIPKLRQQKNTHQQRLNKVANEESLEQSKTQSRSLWSFQLKTLNGERAQNQQASLAEKLSTKRSDCKEKT